MIAQPVEAAGVTVRGIATNVIYEGTERGDFYALRASDGRVIWHKNLGSAPVPQPCHYFPGDVDGIGGAATISLTAPGKGVVYVAGGDGAVHALSLATGAERRGWPVRGVFNPSETHVYGGLNLLNGRLYVTSAGLCDLRPYYGGAVEISVLRHRIMHRFYPVGPPSRGLSGGGIWGYGGVSIDPTTKNVLAATGNAAYPGPQNYRYAEAVVKLSHSLRVIGYSKPPLVGHDVDFGSTPVLFRPTGCRAKLLAAENKSGALVIYSIDAIKAGPEQRLQIADVNKGNLTGVPAWDPTINMLYISNFTNSSDGPYRHGLVALQAARDCKVSLAWQRQVGQKFATNSPPTVANGVVYYGDVAGTEYAFKATTGRLLWHSTGISGRIHAAPTIVNGELLVSAWDGYLYAFGLHRSPR